MTEYRYRVYIIDLSKVVLHSKKFMVDFPQFR
jgi:hypothetical protein